jgi:GAF domain-containing protein
LFSRDIVHIHDILNDAEYSLEVSKLDGYRTMLGVPLLREGSPTPIGVIALVRSVCRPFTEKQIELVKTFADQAVIAIENVRLFEAEQQRTSELQESLQQQTATSEVLSVISSSPANIQPVLEIIGERAEKLCDADVSVTSIVDGDLIRLASVGGYHGCLGVPMVRDEQVVGAIFVAKKQPGLFSAAQVQLLKTFADQAVIAIENVRLFNETKNSLEQQTATADVLKIISRSTFDLHEQAYPGRGGSAGWSSDYPRYASRDQLRNHRG